jgi:D-inositol-3-phosphate glycosyltransferase
MRRLVILSLNHDPLGAMGETHVGGQAKYVLEVAKNLALRDWNIVIYTVGGRGLPARVAIGRNCQLVRVERDCGRPYDYDIEPDEALRLGERILLDAIDQTITFQIIYACFWLSGLAARPISRFFDIPMAFTFCQLGAFKAQWDGAAAVAERVEQERAICAASTAVIATNRDEVAAIMSNYGVPRHKIQFIPRGIDLQMFFA